MGGSITRFSENFGYKEPKPPQVESLDGETRNRLWNIVHSVLGKSTDILLRSFWGDCLKLRFSDFPHTIYGDINKSSYSSKVEEIFDHLEWFEVFDFLESFILIFEDRGLPLMRFIDQVLEQENSPYMFFNAWIIPRMSTAESKAVLTALQNARPYPEVKKQLEDAVESLSVVKPNYRNAIKESIHAVVTMARLVASEEKGTDSAALEQLTQILDLHPAQAGAFIKLYGWASDSKAGIRHPLLGGKVYPEDGTYTLVICCAFINYVIEKCHRLDIELSSFENP